MRAEDMQSVIDEPEQQSGVSAWQLTETLLKQFATRSTLWGWNGPGYGTFRVRKRRGRCSKRRDLSTSAPG